MIVNVDDSDKSLTAPYNWYIDSDGYAEASIKDSTKKIYLHHLILGVPPYNHEVKHINRDRLDNRRSNLQIVSRSYNKLTAPKPKNNTSGYKGVCWAKNQHKWVAYIYYNTIRHHLGSFSTKEEAIEARKKAYDKLTKP